MTTEISFSEGKDGVIQRSLVHALDQGTAREKYNDLEGRYGAADVTRAIRELQNADVRARLQETLGIGM